MEEIFERHPKEKVTLRAQDRLLENFIAMVRSSSKEDLFKSSMQQTLDVASEITGAEKGSIFLLNPAGEVTESILTRGETAPEEKSRLIGSVLNKGLAGWALQHRCTGVVDDTTTDHRWLALADQPYEAGSALAVPIIRGGNIFGILTLLHSSKRHFTTKAVEKIEMTADQIALVLENIKLYVDLKATKKKIESYSQALDREFKKGRKIQQDFLPRNLPQAPGLKIAARFIPAWQVSGDFYDVFTLPGDLVGIVIGDVSDKGIGAALYMALIRSLIRVFAEQNSTSELAQMDGNLGTAHMKETLQFAVAKAVDITNDYINTVHGEEGMFVTLFLGVLEPTGGELVYINAGHETVYLIGKAGIQQTLTANGPAVGILPGITYAKQKIKLVPGSIMFGYTDGVTEARSPQDDMFTRSRLETTISNSVGGSANRFLDGIQSTLFDFINDAPIGDDITMIAVRWK
jgi:sigma-B regulation protein RsbU (phosphoserine phosphatase)